MFLLIFQSGKASSFYRLFKSSLSWFLSSFNALKNINSRIHFLKTFLQRGKYWLLRPLWLVHEELNQELDDVVVQTHHLSVLHTVVQSQAFSAPQEVLSGVVGIGLYREGHRVELVAEEGEEMAVCDHSLGHERPGDILIVPESCKKREGRSIWTLLKYKHVFSQMWTVKYQDILNTALLKYSPVLLYI